MSPISGDWTLALVLWVMALGTLQLLRVFCIDRIISSGEQAETPLLPDLSETFL